MYRLPFLAAVAIGLSIAPLSALAGNDRGNAVAQAEPEVVAGELLVRFADDVTESRIEEINARFGVQVVNRLLGGKFLAKSWTTEEKTCFTHRRLSQSPC